MPFRKSSAVGFGLFSLFMVLFTIVINLAVLGAAVWVVVWVLKAMGVIQ